MDQEFMNLFFDFQSSNLVVQQPNYLTLSGLKISDYIMDGFNFVCNVDNIRSDECKWIYENIDLSIMYDIHSSWVYKIVVDDFIFKIGETSKPLGYRTSQNQIQPSPGTKGRLSRYTTGDTTDLEIRKSSVPYMNANHTISFWAKKCEIVKYSTVINGISSIVEGATQKHQEMMYLENFIKRTGHLPLWNKNKK